MPYKDWDNCIKMKDVPLSVIDELEDYKKYPTTHRIDVRQSTKEALWFIKKQNKMTVMCDAIDLLISTVCFSQMSESSQNILKNIYKAEKTGKHAFKNTSGTWISMKEKEVIVKGVRYDSIKACAEWFGVHRKTVQYRLQSLKPKWKHWQYLEDYGQYDNLSSPKSNLIDTNASKKKEDDE